MLDSQALDSNPSTGRHARSILRREMRADQAVKAVCRALLETMRANEAGARSSGGAEALHDYRVAVRRTRSGLAQLPGVFPRQVVRRFKRGFSWLGERTAPLRDLDVHLLALPRFREWVAPDLGRALDPLERELRELRTREHRELVAALDSRRYEILRAAWGEFLASPVPARTPLPNARRPAADVAIERIEKAHARVVRRGEAIGPASPPGDLHRMRIECKKLRYLLELFAELLAEREVERVVAALKTLQNDLGEHQDLTVQREFLLGIESRYAGPENRATREAAAHVVRRIDELQAGRREAFRTDFAAFCEPAVEEALRYIGLAAGSSSSNAV